MARADLTTSWLFVATGSRYRIDLNGSSLSVQRLLRHTPPGSGSVIMAPGRWRVAVGPATRTHRWVFHSGQRSRLWPITADQIAFRCIGHVPRPRVESGAARRATERAGRSDRDLV